MTNTLYLIRHGETDWNHEGRWQGHADVELNEHGRTQAGLLAQRLQEANIPFNAIYSSDLTRAYQTAWEIGSAVKVAVQLLPALREIDLGTWSGLTRAEIAEHHPVEYALLEQGQDIPRGGAETVTALRQRVVETVMAMVRQHPGETIALVTHGGPVRALLAYASEQSGQPMPEYSHIGNTSISIVRVTLTDDNYTWQIDSCNDMDHLKGVPQATDLMSSPPDDAELPQEWNP